jgi:type II secretory pathway predicted ATPase ExeA
MVWAKRKRKDMDTRKGEFGEKAFGSESGAVAIVKYESQQHALDFAWRLLGDGSAIGLLQGSRGSGKTTVVQQLLKELPRDTSAAVIDGTRIKPRELLSQILARYGYTPDLQSADELMKMISVFAAQQARAYQPPILVIDNSDQMFPSSLQTLGELAGLTEQGKPLLRIILTGERAMKLVVNGKRGGTRRSFEIEKLAPMSANDALIYLHARLEACGISRPDSVFPGDVCDVLHAKSGGLPGRLNEIALEAIKRSRSLPVTVSMLKPRDKKGRKRPAPRVIVSRDGKTVLDHVFNERKVLIGRSEFADIVIDDDFCSKLHVALLLYSNGLVLMDLNSANGTTVNSVKVSTTLLRDNDIISLGSHRLKVVNAPAGDAALAARTSIADTARMRTLELARSKRKAWLRAVPASKKA